MVCLLIGRSVGPLVGWLDRWLADYCVGGLVSWSIDILVSCFSCVVRFMSASLIGWLPGYLVVWLVHWFFWLAVSVVSWLVLLCCSFCPFDFIASLGRRGFFD